MVGKGSLLSVEPDRIITKRAVISGYPLKINKKSCVVRYMFFNRGRVQCIPYSNVEYNVGDLSQCIPYSNVTPCR